MKTQIPAAEHKGFCVDYAWKGLEKGAFRKLKAKGQSQWNSTACKSSKWPGTTTFENVGLYSQIAGFLQLFCSISAYFLQGFCNISAYFLQLFCSVFAVASQCLAREVPSWTHFYPVFGNSTTKSLDRGLYSDLTQVFCLTSHPV